MLSTAEYVCPVWARSRHSKTRCYHQPCHENHHWLHEIHTSILLFGPSRTKNNVIIRKARHCQSMVLEALKPKHLHEVLNNRPRKRLKSRDSLIDSVNLVPDPNFPSEYVTSQCYGRLRKFIDIFSPHMFLVKTCLVRSEFDWTESALLSPKRMTLETALARRGSLIVIVDTRVKPWTIWWNVR